MENLLEKHPDLLLDGSDDVVFKSREDGVETWCHVSSHLKLHWTRVALEIYPVFPSFHHVD